ncbi:(d)CMP kinase [Chloroflexi bacterium TSY]|nr:(d)CMP kinase [Chloroflexi bacterium TSY]
MLPDDLTTAYLAMIKEIQQLMLDRQPPILVAVDGGSGSGKSTLASMIAQELDATLIQSDDFFAADIPDPEWDTRGHEEKVRDGINWRRLRSEALEPLLAGHVAKWHAFDFEAGLRADGTYGMRTDYEERESADLILLDGAYSARPELSDLVTFSVLIDVPVDVRHARLAMREEASFLRTWHERWDEAEVYYFTEVCPPAWFDLVVRNE